jgi:hypothetical protein
MHSHDAKTGKAVESFKAYTDSLENQEVLTMAQYLLHDASAV